MINSEIGSEFFDVPLTTEKSNIFPENTKWFLSGRMSLYYILNDIKQKNKGKKHTAAIPSWCCESMIIPFLDEGIDVKFYSVYYYDESLYVDMQRATECDIVLILDYFGYTGCKSKKTLKLEGFEGVVIRDITHSLFSEKSDDADYYFGSLRKWAGFYTGGFAYGNSMNCENYVKAVDEEYVNIRKSAMLAKAEYIYGKSDDKGYLKVFGDAEQMLENMHCAVGADAEDIQRAMHIDAEFIHRKRRENAGVLLDSLKECAVFKKLGDNDSPLFVPILVKERDTVRKALIENKIYCPVHWPVSEYHRLNEKEKYIYDHELSLVCDQRYEISDMEKIVNVLGRII